MKFIKYLLPPLVAIATFLYFALPLPALAASGTLFFSPAKGTYVAGRSFTIEIRADSGNASRQTTRANISYSSHLLEATSATTSGSDFDNGNVNINQEDGTVTYTAYDITPPTGKNLLAYKVSFKVKSQGKASLTFGGDSAINGSLAERKSATYTLSPSSCPSGQTGTPPNCTKPSTSPSPTKPTAPSSPSTPPAPSQPAPAIPTDSALLPLPIPSVPDTDEPVVSEEPVELPSEPEDTFGIGNIRTKTLYDTTTLDWESNLPGRATVKYGTSSDTLDNETAVIQTSPTAYTAEMTELKPGVKYFYMISAVDTSDTAVTDDYSGTVLTKGYPVRIAIQQNEAPLEGATIGLENYSGTTVTNDEGTVDFELKDGSYTLTIKQDAVTIKKTIAVKALAFDPGGVPDTQNFQFAVSGNNVGGGSGWIIGATIGGIILLVSVGAVIVIIRKKRSQAAAASGYQSIIEDDWTPTTTYTNPVTGEFNVPQPPSNYPQPPRTDIPENEYFADLGPGTPKT